MTSRRRPASALALFLLAAAAAQGCSSGDSPPTAAPGFSRGLDTRHYVDDYRSPGEADAGSAVGGVPLAAAPGSASAAAGGRGGSGGPVGPDGYVDAGTSDFVDLAVGSGASGAARSTFALDVDTGSFGVSRALLRTGAALPAAAIRPEEWVNALPVSDPAPTDTDLALTTETGLAPSLHDGTQLVRVAVRARDVAPADQPPMHVTLVVDRSGSMDAPDRLGLVQSSLALLADRLPDDDTVSVVSFESRARPVLEPTPASDTDAIVAAVDQLTPAGSTDLEAGLELGYREARATFDPHATNVVVLASDGGANVGRTGAGSITDTIEQEGADGIRLVTVGYGTDGYGDRLMEQLADLGDGFYSYVDDYDDAEQLFGGDLATQLVPVADQARAQVTFDPAVVSSYRLIGYENRVLADDDFTDMTVDAGELGSGHHATALYEVRLRHDLAPGSTLGTASVRWLTTGGATRTATADVVAADPDAALPTSIALPAAAADLAQELKSAAPFRGRTDLAAITGRIRSLVDACVPGADDLLALVTDAGGPGQR